MTRPGLLVCCYDDCMRRALAALLVLAFSLPLIAPAFASAAPESSLPACCRRNGSHHCAMRGMVVDNIPIRFATLSERCPYSPFNHGALMLPHAFAAPGAPAAKTPLTGPAALIREAEAGYRVSFDRSRQKRGPPQLLAL